MSFITQGGSYEWKLTQGTATYDKTNFSEGKLNDALFKELSIGNVVARELSLRLYNATLSTETAFDLVLEETDADGLTIEVPKGTYFIDTQETSPYSEYKNVTAFDAMLKTEVVYLKSGEWTAKTDSAIVSEIASDIGVAVEPATLAYLTENPITFTEAPSMGEDGTTDREMLSYIAVLRGGNWIINDANELQLVLLTGQLNSVDIVYIGADGKFYSDKLINMPASAAFVTFDSIGASYSTPKAEITDESVVLYLDHSGACQTAAYYEIKGVAPLEEVIEIGDEVVGFDVSPTETVTRIELVVNSTLSYRSPSGLTEEQWQALGGKCITAALPIMASQEAADNLYSMLAGLTYIPHEAQSIYVDPDVPLGTKLHIKNDTVVLSNRTLNVDLLCASDLTAEPTEALQSNYPYIDPVVRQTRREIAQNKASIQVNADNITSEVERAEESEGNIRTEITSVRQTASEFSVWHTVQTGQAQSAAEAEMADAADAAVDAYDREVQTYMRYSGGTLELGETGNNFKAKLDNTKLAFTGADGKDAAWVGNNEFNTNHSVIQEGGSQSFNSSNGYWLQRVASNKHFQIVWVNN